MSHACRFTCRRHAGRKQNPNLFNHQITRNNNQTNFKLQFSITKRGAYCACLIFVGWLLVIVCLLELGAYFVIWILSRVFGIGIY